MNIETLMSYQRLAEYEEEQAKLKALALMWAVGRIQDLEIQLEKSSERIAYYRKVCDENRWPYDKE